MTYFPFFTAAFSSRTVNTDVLVCDPTSAINITVRSVKTIKGKIMAINVVLCGCNPLIGSDISYKGF